MERPASDFQPGKMTWIHVGVAVTAVNETGIRVHVTDQYGLSVAGTVPDTKHLHRDIKRLVHDKSGLPIERLSLAFTFDRSLPRPVAIPYPLPPRKNRERS